MICSKFGPGEAGGEERTCVGLSGTAMEPCVAPSCG